MKTIQKSVLGVVLAVSLGTGAYATCASDVDMGGNTISNVADPVASTDAVNKRFFYDTLKEGFIRDDSKQVVHQISTALMWQDNAAVATVTKSWSEAKTYCTDLDHGGFTDWRLPTIEELVGIIKSDVNNPSISTIFQHTASSFYWSSTSRSAGDAFTAWGVYFGDGLQYYDLQSSSNYVRCVRAGQ